MSSEAIRRAVRNYRLRLKSAGYREYKIRVHPDLDTRLRNAATRADSSITSTLLAAVEQYCADTTNHA